MKAKVIKFNNGNTIQTIQTETVGRSRPKFPIHLFMARATTNLLLVLFR